MRQVEGKRRNGVLADNHNKICHADERTQRPWEYLCTLCVQCKRSNTAQRKHRLCPLLSISSAELGAIWVSLNI